MPILKEAPKSWIVEVEPTLFLYRGKVLRVTAIRFSKTVYSKKDIDTILEMGVWNYINLMVHTPPECLFGKFFILLTK